VTVEDEEPPPVRSVRTAAGAGRALDRRITRTRRKAVRRLRRDGRRLLGRKPPAHLLHPGKTGGTAIKSALKPLRTAGRYEIQLHGHKTTLRDIPRGEKIFFVVRDPVERYVSAYNSRLRQGLPRYKVPWTPEERAAFNEFPSADELARALSCEEADRRARACQAMSSIQHVRDSYWRWLIHGQMLGRRRGDLMLVLWLPDIADGFARLCDLLELPGSPTLPSDEVGAHRSPSYVNTYMSEQAMANARRWYAQDYGFIEVCARLDCFVGPTWTNPLHAQETGAEA
jgi:hypothetical protein